MTHWSSPNRPTFDFTAAVLRLDGARSPLWRAPNGQVLSSADLEADAGYDQMQAGAVAKPHAAGRTEIPEAEVQEVAVPIAEKRFSNVWLSGHRTGGSRYRRPFDPIRLNVC
jgi:hypothetical protein